MGDRIIVRPGNLLYPLPVVLVTSHYQGIDNVLTIAWTGTVNTNPPMVSISVRPERFSYDLIKNSGEFAINIPISNMVREVDFCGVRSGRQVDKFTVCSFERVQSQFVQAPVIGQCPVALECKVVEQKVLGSHTLFLAQVVGVSAWQNLYNKKNGAIEIQRLPLLIYNHGEYQSNGQALGKFGFSVKKRR